MRSSSSSSFIDNYHSSRHDLRNLNDLRNRCISSGLSQLSLLASHHLQCRHTTSHYTNSLALDPEDETLLLSGSSEGMLSVYDLIKLHKPSNTKVQVKTNPIKHMKVHEGLISTVQWFPMDKGVCISSSMDGTVNLYDASDFTVIETFQLRSPVYKAKFNTDGNMIATALLNGTIVLCDPNTGDSSHTLVGHDCAVMNLDWCPTEQHLLASSCKDGSVRIWDIRKGGRDSVVLCLDWHQDHTALTSGTGAASSNRNRIGSSNVNSFRKIDWKKVEASRAHDMAAISVKYTQCGRYLLTNGCDDNGSLGDIGYTGKIRKWNAFSGALLPAHYGTGWASTLPFDIVLIDDPVTGPPGDLFVTPHGQEGSIALSSIHGRENCAVGVLAAHFARITAVVYRTKYQQLISAGAEGLLNVWTPKSLINAICDEDNGEEDIPWRRKKKHKSHHKYNASRDQNSDSSETNQPSLVPTESNTEYLPPIIRSYLEDVQRQNMVATFSVSSSSGST